MAVDDVEKQRRIITTKWSQLRVGDVFDISGTNGEVLEDWKDNVILNKAGDWGCARMRTAKEIEDAGCETVSVAKTLVRIVGQLGCS